PYLRDYTPGQPIKLNKSQDQTKYNFNKEPRKYSFNYLLNKMANNKPKFLEEFIDSYNLSLDQTISLSFS
ncbi:10338_t:CDS:1, partial [Gigaspora rosea]